MADWFLEGDDVFSCSRKWNCLWKCHLSFLYFLGGGIFEDLIIDFLIVLIMKESINLLRMVKIFISKYR